MMTRMLTIIAALGLLAACETAPKDGGDAAGSAAAGAATASSSTSGTSSSTSSSGSSASTSSGSSSASSSSSAAAEATLSDQLVSIGDTVLFDFDSSTLSSDAQGVLRRQAAFLSAHPAVRIIIEGHCDERGTREYNLALGERRASATRDFLVAQGVNAARIRIVSYGKERPAAVGSNETAWAQNRRSVSIIN